MSVLQLWKFNCPTKLIKQIKINKTCSVGNVGRTNKFYLMFQNFEVISIYELDACDPYCIYYIFKHLTIQKDKTGLPSWLGSGEHSAACLVAR